MQEQQAAHSEGDLAYAEAVLDIARQKIARARARADVLLFAADEVEGRELVLEMQEQARLLNEAAQGAPRFRREAELLMGQCARVWTGILTAEPWAWKQ